MHNSGKFDSFGESAVDFQVDRRKFSNNDWKEFKDTPGFISNVFLTIEEQNRWY